MPPGSPSLPTPRVPAPVPKGAPRRKRAVLGVAVLGAVSVLAAACGGDEAPASVQGVVDVAPDQNDVAGGDLEQTRTRAGIAAAGGRNLAMAEPCPAPGSPGARETVKIALTTVDVINLDIIALGSLVFDDPAHIIDAYVNEINAGGGIGGHCFEFHDHVYGFTDTAGDFGRICSELPQQDPLVMLTIVAGGPILECATLGAQIPTIGLYSQFPHDTIAAAGGLLRVNYGASEYLLENGIDAAYRSGVVTTDDTLGLLYAEDDDAATLRAAFDSTSEAVGLKVAASVGAPPELTGTVALVVEQQFGELGGEIFDPDMAAFDRAVGELPPELGGLMVAIRQFFLATAAGMRDAGVTAVVGSTGSESMRNLMRAAELSDWHPKWIVNDSHYVMVALTDVPEAQGANLVQVSAGRSADDPIDGLDRGCLSLRNTFTEAEPFSHRFHTDAWGLMTAICDYLDVVFGAISRVDGPLTRESFLAALTGTDYETDYGQRIRFSAGDLYGADSFRVLTADPYCVLNEWGCMRSLTGWLEPADAAARDGDGAAGGTIEG